MSALAGAVEDLRGKTAPDGRTAKVKAKDRPDPLTTARAHPAHWVYNRVVTLAQSLLGTHVFVLAWIGLYFLLFELVHPVKAYWDTLLSGHVRVLSQVHWDTWRHLFRGGGESYLATLAVMQFLYNPYKHSVRVLKSAWSLVVYFLMALACAIPIFVLGALAVGWVQHWIHTGSLAPSVGAHPGLATKLYADTWTTKIVALVAGAVGARRLMLPVYDFNMRYLAVRRVSLGKRTHVWHTPAYRALVNETRERLGSETAESVHSEYGSSVSRLVVGGMLVVCCLAVYGVYVLHHYA